MTQHWIDGEDLEVGQIGFLWETCRQGRADVLSLNDHPPHTNRSHEPRLHGWCGESNNVSTYGRGMARVVRRAKNGRALVEAIRGADLVTALEEAGYPDLAE